ncbi:hypothetical protein PRK78_004649 [Emydomyces testavorans]|uniref:Aminoglycoside phosphotransferase domain-containing protein n=1 Tax=Emydomyces testavorans TaxID=2070801 RepID=A0AAF0DLW5_9EURO|nr:hypothetical protein PRK78_004649 [Emydomyces testavorans]
MPEPTKALTLRGEITLEDAMEKEENMLLRLQWPRDRVDFLNYIYRSRSQIKGIVFHHLGLPAHYKFALYPLDDWLHGSFNFCIPVGVDYPSGRRRFMLRCPLPYKLGQAVEEKLRCEVATFEYIRQHCPEVPIPYLWGVGLPDGECFTPIKQLPLFRRWLEYLRRACLWLLRRPLPCAFTRHPCPYTLKSGYLLMEYIEESKGKMLAFTWSEAQKDEELRRNFFKSLSRVLLSLGRAPLPRIASFTMANDGVLSLTNRPLTLRLPHLENQGIPTDIPRDLMYVTVDSYLADILHIHDSRLRHQPNSVSSKYDASGQMAVLTMMRALQLTRRDLRHGPFVFQLTDLSTCNIFVDDKCNITALVDLEWGCSLPVEMVCPPYWLSSECISIGDAEDVERFNTMRLEFMDVFEHEEQSMYKCDTSNAHSRTMIMKKAWEMGTFWYLNSLVDPNGTYTMFVNHVQPMFASDHYTNDDLAISFQQIVHKYWAMGADDIIAAKVKDLEQYQQELPTAFENAIHIPPEEKTQS